MTRNNINDGIPERSRENGHRIFRYYVEYYLRHIYQSGLEKFGRFAVEVWGIAPEGKNPEQLAKAGIEALAEFIREIGLPTTLRELGVDEKTDLKAIADSCNCVSGAFKKMTHEEILEIFRECY